MKKTIAPLFIILILVLFYSGNVFAETFLFEGGEWEEDIQGQCPEYIGSLVNSLGKDSKWLTSNAKLYETIVFQPIEVSPTLLSIRMKSKYKNGTLKFSNLLFGAIESTINYEVDYTLYYSSDPGNEPVRRTYFTSKTYKFNGKTYNYGGKDIHHWRGNGSFKIDDDSYHIEMVNLEPSLNCVTEFDPDLMTQKGRIGKFETTITKLISTPICNSENVRKVTGVKIE